MYVWLDARVPFIVWPTVENPWVTGLNLLTYYKHSMLCLCTMCITCKLMWWQRSVSSFLFVFIHFVLFVSLSSKPGLCFNLFSLFLFSSNHFDFLFFFVFLTPFPWSPFILTHLLSGSSSRLEVSSWRVVVLMVFIFVRINMTLPVCQRSLPVTWPGFHKYVLFHTLWYNHETNSDGKS